MTEFNLEYPPDRFWSHVEKRSSCWLWRGATMPNGYGRCTVAKTGFLAHRFAWATAHNSDVPAGMFVLHKCDVRACVNPEHLFLGTQIDNMADMVAKGRGQRGAEHWSVKYPEKRVRGERHHRARLTNEQVQEIRQSIEKGSLQKPLMKKFGVSQTCISLIARGERRVSQ